MPKLQRISNAHYNSSHLGSKIKSLVIIWSFVPVEYNYLIFPWYVCTKRRTWYMFTAVVQQYVAVCKCVTHPAASESAMSSRFVCGAWWVRCTCAARGLSLLALWTLCRSEQTADRSRSVDHLLILDSILPLRMVPCVGSMHHCKHRSNPENVQGRPDYTAPTRLHGYRSHRPWKYLPW